MSAAPAYSRSKNFLDNTSDRTDHAALNSEFDAVSTSINALRSNAAEIQGDDGTLKEGIVSTATLADDVKQLLGVASSGGAVVNPSGAWEDARGLIAERSYFDGRPKAFSFLAMDQGLVYFKLSQAIADWSPGYPFGKGDPGAQGETGPQATVDYSLTVRKDVTISQSMNGPLSALSFSASQSVAAPLFQFQGAPLRLTASNTRLRLDDGASKPQLASLELASLVTNGAGATNTGVKLANGTDIGLLFDPAGAAAGKLAGVAVGSAQASLTGKTTITVTLAVVNNQLQIGVTTA
ncbi:hypothetical protein [Herbaspirillum chlorophenolicum]|uniref:hypothetical protein n=1 Tax=Herbaspirillum chlorophenolicum TaxID=211589 RepID=UPI00067CBD88|nr:hypothetical protein [Herbaspirillum chlorophenolicum]